MRKVKETIVAVLSISLLFSPEAYSQNIYNGLVACYSFSGNANDGSGNNNNGIVNGATLTSDRYGNLNSAYRFNGVSDYVSIPPNAFKNSKYTFAAWVFIQSSDRSGMDIVSVGDSTQWTHQALGIDYQYEIASLCGIYYNHVLSPADTSVCFNDQQRPGLQTWMHLVFAKSSNQIELFINGVSVAGEGLGPVEVPPDYGMTTKANIGARSNLTQFFNGMIDDVVIYNRALTVQEVLQLYQQGVPCSAIPLTPTTNSPTICGRDSTTIRASGPINATFRWYDSTSAGNPLFEGNPFKTPILSTTTYYYVSSVVNNIEGPRAEVIVKVFSSPQITCSIPSATQTDLPTSISTTVASGTAPLNYYFDFGNGDKISSVQSSTTYEYSQPGLYEITVSVTDTNNCSAQCTGNIRVIKQVPVPTAKDTAFCGTGSAKLVASGGTTYHWYDADTGGNLLFIGNPYLTPVLSNSVDYYVCDYENNFEGPRLKVSVTIYPPPQLICLTPQEVVEGNSFAFSTTVESGTLAVKYIFNFGDGIQITTSQQTASHHYDQFGTYIVDASVIDSNGCVASCSKNIRAIEIFIPNVITANNDALNDRLTVFEKVNDHWEGYDGSIPFSMVIANRWGEQLYKTNNSTKGWDGGDVSAGVYFFEITFDGRQYKGWVELVR
jgi:hypothetical protein